MFFASFRALFDGGYTPGGVLRTLSQKRSRGMIANYVEKRLPTIIDQDERDAVSNYLFQNAMLPDSTESCVNRFLTTPFLIAKQPLVHRIPKLQVGSVSFLYGSHDWMDVAGGLQTQVECDNLTHDGKVAPSVDVFRVDQAGHLLMLDNWQEFNSGIVLSAGGKGVEQSLAKETLSLPTKLSPHTDMPRRRTLNPDENRGPVQRRSTAVPQRPEPVM